MKLQLNKSKPILSYYTQAPLLNKQLSLRLNCFHHATEEPKEQTYQFSRSIIPKSIGDIPSNLPMIESPRSTWLNEINDIIGNNHQRIDAPPVPQINEKKAEKLIVIRKRKMKKHKLKKLRRKMKFEWAKVRQRREMRKEKAFQAKLISQIKDAEMFNAEQYVSEKLRKAEEEPLPRYWKGRRLPAFIIKEKLGIK